MGSGLEQKISSEKNRPKMGACRKKNKPPSVEHATPKNVKRCRRTGQAHFSRETDGFRHGGRSRGVPYSRIAPVALPVSRDGGARAGALGLYLKPHKSNSCMVDCTRRDVAHVVGERGVTVRTSLNKKVKDTGWVAARHRVNIAIKPTSTRYAGY